MGAEREMNKNLDKALLDLGLSGLEGTIYQTSLRLGPTTFSRIAREAHIPRTRIYKIMQNLEKKGLAKFSSRTKYTQFFIVESPSVILEKLREEEKQDKQLEENFISLLPELLLNYHQGSGPTKIQIIEGREQFIKAFFETLEEVKGGSCEFWGSAEEFVQYIGMDTEKRFIEKRLQQGTSIRTLTFNESFLRRMKPYDTEQKREMRVMKRGTEFFSTAIQMFGRKAIIWQPKIPLTIFIEDEYIVQMFRSMFNAAWITAEK